MRGQISDNPLAELVREIAVARLSGALRLARERVKAVVYFEAGEVVHARSNLRLHRLAECLRRWGVVSEERLYVLLTESMSDEEAGAAIVSSGALGEAEMSALRAQQGADVLRLVLLWTDGEWGFDPRARLEGRQGDPIEIRPLLAESARRLPEEFASARVSNDDETWSPAPAQPPADLQLQPTEAFVLSRMDAPLRLGELVAVSGLPERAARHALYTLALAGLITRESWPQALSERALAQARRPTTAAATDAAQKAAPQPVEKSKVEEEATASLPDPREEMEALFALVEASNHYLLLGVRRDATPGEVKRAYYSLAKRFHPDRFHRDVDDAQRTRIEKSFAKIAQAYEVLKDAKLRAGYDLKMEAAAREEAKRAASKPNPAANAAANQSPQYRAEESFQMGLDALKHGNRLQAVMHFGEAARLVPRQPRYRAYYGHALGGDPGTRRQGEAELKAAVTLDADNVTYRVMLAVIYRDLGLRLRAEGELQRALNIDPKNTEARRMLDALRNAEAKA